MPPLPPLTRRQLLRGAAVTALTPLLSANLVACSASDDAGPSTGGPPRPEAPLSPRFPHGVASGDPLAERVILWTRLTPEREGAAQLSWEVAEDEQFERVVARGSSETSSAVDYTLKVDVSGLAPASTYYYRFFHGEDASNVGRTKTLPRGSVDQVRLAMVSCASFAAGYFHVYREVAGLEVDAVLHLGDYIYEYGMGQYSTEQATELERTLDPPEEATTLSGYRARYAQHRTDRALSDCHAAHPFIAVWDDHEVANNASRDGAENHQADEGDYQARKQAALQAYFEWMPLRPPSDDGVIYRAFHFGELVDLLMLDTRFIGRDAALSYLDFLGSDGVDVDAARVAIADEGRTMLGAEQRAWLFEELAKATGTWQVLGQQVLFGRYNLPVQVVGLLEPGEVDDGALTGAAQVLFDAASAARKAPGERSAEEQALLDDMLPYNLDAWDGYAAEREALLEHALESGARLVVLAGDTHNAWASTLRTRGGTRAGVEVATASVTTPGLDGVLGELGAATFESVASDLMPDLEFVNLQKRGYVHLDFKPEGLTATYRFIRSATEPNATVDEATAPVLAISAELGLERSA